MKAMNLIRYCLQNSWPDDITFIKNLKDEQRYRFFNIAVVCGYLVACHETKTQDHFRIAYDYLYELMVLFRQTNRFYTRYFYARNKFFDIFEGTTALMARRRIEKRAYDDVAEPDVEAIAEQEAEEERAAFESGELDEDDPDLEGDLMNKLLRSVEMSAEGKENDDPSYVTVGDRSRDDGFEFGEEDDFSPSVEEGEEEAGGGGKAHGVGTRVRVRSPASTR